jgi:hypothetical protein
VKTTVKKKSVNVFEALEELGNNTKDIFFALRSLSRLLRKQFGIESFSCDDKRVTVKRRFYLPFSSEKQF